MPDNPERAPYPPITVDQVPAKYHPSKLLCQGGCLYASCLSWEQNSEQGIWSWGWIDFICAQRKADARHSSIRSLNMCDLDRCPWKQVERLSDANGRREQMLALAKRQVADHTPGTSPFMNYDPAHRTDYLVADLFPND